MMTRRHQRIPKINTQRKDDAQMQHDWARALVLAIPFGALAFIVGALLEKPSGQVLDLDVLLYPILAVMMLLLEVLLIFKPKSLQFVASSICLGCASFFLTKLAYLLFFLPPNIDVLHQMTETFFWIPMIYLLSFLIPRVWIGQIASVAFTALTLMLSVAYILMSSFSSFDWGIVYAVAQLNLANTVFLVLTSVFIRFKERYAIAKTEEVLASHLLRHDQLTELANRFALEEYLEKLLEDDQQEVFSVLFIDLDGFKQVNDNLGHQAGDQLLKEIVARLSQSVTENDFFARLSGDEFIWVTKGKQSTEAEKTAQLLLAQLKEPFIINEKRIRISASIGLCFYPKDGRDSKTLLQHADLAMYQAKKAGKNNYFVYENSLTTLLEQQRELKHDLREALINKELELHYQPIFSLTSNALVKFEALLRWKHPKHGYISPATFIPLAEESGLIIPLGKWVLEEACSTAKSWQGYMPNVAVAVNISPLQLALKTFPQEVINILKLSGLSSPCLELEVTESVVLGNLDEVTRKLNHLRGFGIKIAIDDFGTGYSSLSYLQNLPVDTLKIDRSFVDKLATPLEEPHFAVALIEAIVGLSKHLELTVVAEGIEAADQLAALRNAGCHLGQGYFYSKPVPKDALAQFVKQDTAITDNMHVANLN